MASEYGTQTAMPLPAGLSGALPARAGLGLKPEHLRSMLQHRPDISFFEVHAENFMVEGGPLLHFLHRLRDDYPLSVHGVGLSIGGMAPPDADHLTRLAGLLERFQPASFSEHLAWSTHNGVFFNDLLPLVYDPVSLARVCAHIDQIQERLGRRLLLENPATYVAYAGSSLDEADFIGQVIRRTGCGLLLDVNNLHVTCRNHQRDPLAYLRALPLHAVGEIHLAGCAEHTTADGGALLIDSHDRAVAEDVWGLYCTALTLTGPQPTLIERDANLPPLEEQLAEAQTADRMLCACLTA